MLIPVAGVALSILWIIQGTDGSSKVPLSVILLVGSIVGAALVFFLFINKQSNTYRTEFKSKVFKTFVEMLYPRMTYTPDSGISRETFTSSELFNRPDRFNAEDYFKGTVGDAQVEFSEVHAQDVSRSNSNGKSSTRTSTIFRGLFIALETQQNVYGNVIVVPDTAESSFGGFGRWIQRSLGSFFQGKKMIYFEEYPEFEKQFVVYSSEEEEARRVLTPALLRSICDLRNKWNNRIYISFFNNRIYMALPIKGNLFETKLSQSLLEGGVISKLYEELALCFGVIEDFARKSEA